ncbi:uncharacterized protein LOC143594506 [Bidens hawaiensis]|uniref:uncharacterized protein LOC143594506 n=1 Tax=Bidens hawaiensis TaxID=980011 RepID=UPI00404AFBD2
MEILPPKQQDPGTPIILIQVGDFNITRALLDLGAGVSILPGNLYDQYVSGPLRKADTTVMLADLTLKLPRGIVTDVIMTIKDFYYPVNFLVLDYVIVDPKQQPNIILNRPFLATANAFINYRTGVVEMVFVINGLNPHKSEEDATEECAICCKETVEHALQLQEEEKAVEVYAAIIGKPPWFQQVERLPDTIDSKLRLSPKSPPGLELKELRKHLNYMILG